MAVGQDHLVCGLLGVAMSAETLRRAAAAMRERAEAATPGPWSAADEHELLGPDAEPAWCVSNMRPGYESMSPTDGYLGDVAVTSLGFHKPRDEHNAEHIASWHPAVALAVAEWLDEAADHLKVHEDYDLDPALHPHVCPTAIEGVECSVLGQALTVARTYLGEEA